MKVGKLFTMQRGTTWQMIGVVCLTVICAVGGILIYMERQRRDAQEVARLQEEIQVDLASVNAIRDRIYNWQNEHQVRSWRQASALKTEVDKYKDAFYELRTKQARLREIQQGITGAPTRSETDKEVEDLLDNIYVPPTPSEKVIIPHQ